MVSQVWPARFEHGPAFALHASACPGAHMTTPPSTASPVSIVPLSVPQPIHVAMLTGSPRPAPRTPGTACATPASTWPSPAAQHRLGHPRSPRPRLSHARPHQVQPGEERHHVRRRVVVPGRCGVLRRQLLAERLVVIARHRDGQAAAWRDEARVPPRPLPGGIGVEEVQDRAEDDAHRLVQVDDGPQPRGAPGPSPGRAAPPRPWRG